MEVSVMQLSVLSCLQSPQASTSSSGVSSLLHRNALVAGRSFSSAKSVSVWKRVNDYKEQRRSVRRASSGGTRRDQQKIVARTQKRRSRHVKGVTPTKDELLDQLAEEEEADKELEFSSPDIDEEDEGVSDENDGNSPTGIKGSAGEVSAEDDSFVLQEKPSPVPELVKEPDSSDGKSRVNLEKYWKSVGSVTDDGIESKDTSENLNEEQESRDETAIQDADTANSGREEIVENDDNTFTIRFRPEGDQGDAQKQSNGVASSVQDGLDQGGSVASQVLDTAQDTAKDVSSSAQNTVEETGKNLQEAGDVVRENVEGGLDQTGTVAEELTDTAQDTAQDVSNTVQNTVEETGKNLQETGDVVRENVEEGLGQAGTVVEELTDTAQDTAQDVAATVQKTAEDSGESLSEAGDAIREGLSEVGSQGVGLAREGADAVGKQVQEGQKEAEKNLSEFRSQAEEVGERAGQVLEKVAAEAGKSAENVGDSLAVQLADSAGTVGVIGGEALRLGEVIVNAVGEAAGFTQETGTANGSGSKQGSQEKPGDSAEEESKDEEDKEESEGQSIDNKKDEPSEEDEEESEKQSIDSKKDEPSETEKPEDDSPYASLKVTVAGATGRTGRLIVEELVSKGVPVRALVRDPAKARNLERMLNVEVVKADLYNYEAVKRALGDSNVVICAIGASGFPFDPIGTYQVEFEGVKNLVAAAKNGGKIKKFVLITTIGVSFLQIVPLIFWKKQAELYLQRSGLDYTIIRPGGLKNGVDKGESILMKRADTQFGGSITRKKVAELCVDAVITPEASEKTVEVVSGGRGGQAPAELFGNLR